MREWALILFTILAQMSVGAFVVLGLVHLWAMRRFGPQQADRLADRALLAIGPTLALGFLASLFHLGSPLVAYRALFNLASSWLSREIAFGITFAVLGALFAFLQWRKLGSFAVRNLVALLAALVGLALVYVMARVYMLPTQPAWNTWATPVSFYLTTFLLGALAMGSAFVLNYALLRRQDPKLVAHDMDMLRGALRGIALTALVCLVLQLVVAPLTVATLAAGSTQAVQSAGLLMSQYRGLFVLELALLVLGAGVFGLWLYRSALKGEAQPMLARLAFAAFALTLVGEVVGRYLFYTTHVKIGL